jgi:hypothetical protein
MTKEVRRAAETHQVDVTYRPVGLSAWMLRAVCSCGWEGPSRDPAHKARAQADAASHEQGVRR